MKKNILFTGIGAVVVLGVILSVTLTRNRTHPLPEEVVEEEGQVVNEERPTPPLEDWQVAQDEYRKNLWRKDAILILNNEFSGYENDGVKVPPDITSRIVSLLNEYKNDPTIFDRIILANNGEVVERVQPAIIDHSFFDFDNDEKKELLVVFNNLSFGRFINAVSEGSSTVLVLDENDGKYEISYKKLADGFIFGGFYEIGDINNNQQPDFTYVLVGCGAHTCHPTLVIPEWANGQWNSLSKEGQIGGANSRFSFEDKNGDGSKEIIVFGGQVGSVGAGMQRDWVLTYAFDSSTGAYELLDSHPVESDEHIYFPMLDSYYYLRDGKYKEALESSLHTLEIGESVNTPENISEKKILAYAGIEAMMGYLLQSSPDDASAERILNSLSSYQFPTENYVEGNFYVSAAHVFWDSYEVEKDVKKACVAMAKFVIEHPGETDFFEWYGYNQERITLDKICPLTAAE